MWPANERIKFARFAPDSQKAMLFASGLCTSLCGTKDTDDMKIREVIRLLEKDGWRHMRTKGSHRQFQHSVKPGTVTVSGKLSIDVPLGTLNSILKQAGLKR